MYFADLTPYSYLPRQSFGDLPPVLNVGWLDADHQFPTGNTPEGFVERLWEYCQIRVEATRGLHECELCPSPPMGWSATRGAETLLLGSAEIRVFARDVVFAAPNLVFHYVVDHQYRPPDEFVRAVLDGNPRPGTPEYAALVAEYDPELMPQERRGIKVNRVDRGGGRK